MNRRSFRTKNTLNLHSLVYITVMCFVLVAFFLALGNVGKIVSIARLDTGKADGELVQEALEEGASQLPEERTETVIFEEPGILSRYNGGNGDLKAALWGDGSIIDSLASQLVIMEQSFDRISDLTDLEGYDLLVVTSSSVSESDLDLIYEFVKSGGNVWFTDISKKLAMDKTAQKMMGINKCGHYRSWPGMRVSGDIAAGNIMENPKYKVSAVEVSLKNKTKLYACALPRGYKKIEFEDLPPLIWRYIGEENYGSVYVCNGSFMEEETLYFMLPAIFSELKGNYVYGVLNTYCAFVKGFPYTKNEERETWKQFYSRDKMAIAQDLLSSQYLRYYTGYGAHITYFSDDYRELLNTEDKDLRYYTDNIESSMGLLALKENGELFLSSSSEKLLIIPWYLGCGFIEDGKYCLPIDFEYGVENQKEETFNLLGSAVGLGYYTFSNDVDELLNYDKEDVWDEYCKYQEVVFGIGQQHCSWLERVTAAQALERLCSHLNADTDIEYGSHTIDITTDAEKYWLIFKGKAEEIEVTGGTAKSIGNGCFMIEVDGGHAQIAF